jgi:Enoyl-CoA hydratase/carnithine racemase
VNYEHILFDVHDNVGYITLNRPEKRNPIPNPAKSELLEVFDICDFDDSIRAVVIRGAGGNFSAGGDLNAMQERIQKGERGTRLNCRLAGEMNWRLRNVQKPTIAWVEGAIAGAGICLALSCDFQVVAEDAKMVFAFVNIGYVPDSGATYFVTRAIGTVRATELFMSGKRFTGREAAEWGLFTEAVAADKLEERVKQYIEKYSHGPTKAYANIKTMINRAQYADFVAGMQSEIECQGECEQTEDFKEAVNAFFEKRKPVFKGC